MPVVEIERTPLVAPQTEQETTLDRMIQLVRQGEWTRGVFLSRATGKSCALGLVRRLTIE